MIKLGFIHGFIISVVIGISAFFLFQLSEEKEWPTFILMVMVIVAWCFSARIYKTNYGSISFLTHNNNLTKLFKFAFGASTVWAPFVSLATIYVANFDLPIYLITLAIVIPLATIQVVGALTVCNVFIKENSA